MMTYSQIIFLYSACTLSESLHADLSYCDFAYPCVSTYPIILLYQNFLSLWY